MELKEFVEQVLVQISQGVKAAKAGVEGTGLEINSEGRMPGNHHQERWVEFDVALTAEDRGTAKAGIGVVGGLLALGGSGEKGYSERTVSRVRFRVHLCP